MMHPVRNSASWLAGRLFLLLLIVAALVAWDAYRDESTLLTAQLKGLVPDAELIERLERGQAELEAFARDREQHVNARLQGAQAQGVVAIDQRIAEVQSELEYRESQRRSSTQRTLALLTGKGFEQDLENEIDLRLLAAERDALEQVKGQLAQRREQLRETAERLERARVRTLKTWDDYLDTKAALAHHEREHPGMILVPGSDAWARRNDLRRLLNERARRYNTAGQEFHAARDRLRQSRAVGRPEIELVRFASAGVLEPLDELIATRSAALQAAQRQAERIQRSVQQVFFTALWILIVVTLAPVGIKAAWYWIVAPLAETRPPIRLRPQAAAVVAGVAEAAAAAAANVKVSAVSQEVLVGEHEELLVQPEFVQSSAERSRKQTQWLLDASYPLTSLAAGMVALDRIRGTAADAVVVSSKTDPFAEVGVIELPEGAALVLQPRNLVGLVQPIDRPIRLRRQWLFNVSALITFQFRYLVFEGPGRLIVQGCRGVRIEQAGRGRSIDQGATIGFSANLEYSPRRSETFGAYLMGTRGLFNDSFAGGPGFYVYEEMPYFGRKAGITGRGLEGLVDGVLKVFGI
jgi:uncharacterized protein (AIM24 family)